ncbi:uncharacterized protein LOC110699974 [Chenopodium quinoa]|uniref:uncharacterized protein LOC110699974 n=1 Tax=Chenopodium quinoa TaxID=63459 RepID=UPI000B79AECD|nr:uncharacterized protein LOC110699974 [Chenopodium quinoa]
MEVPNYPLYCYWGGEIIHKDGDVTYRGGNQNFIFVNPWMTYSHVLNKLYEELSIDPRFMELKVVMWYPMTGAYVAIPLNDDNALRAMWIVVTQTSCIAMNYTLNSMEQLIPLTNQSVGIGSFIRMLINPKYVNVYLSKISYPTSSPNVGTSTSTQPQAILDSLDPNNVDVFGDVGMTNTDEDDDEDVIEACDKEIKDSAPTTDFNEVSQHFESLQQLKDVVKSYSIVRNQTTRVVEAEPEKYVVECKRKEQCSCSWRLRGVKDPTISTFKILWYNGPHASHCVGDIDSVDHKLLTFEFVCNALLDVLRVDPSLKIKTIVQLVKEKFEFSITYKRAWLEKQKVRTDRGRRKDGKGGNIQAVNFMRKTSNPNLKRVPGQQSTRMQNEMDERPYRAKKACSVCRRPGHNKRTVPIISGVG